MITYIDAIVLFSAQLSILFFMIYFVAIVFLKKWFEINDGYTRAKLGSPIIARTLIKWHPFFIFLLGSSFIYLSFDGMM